MQRRQFIQSAAGAIATLPAWQFAHADNWPGRPVRIIVPFTPGGTTDVVTRLIGNELGKSLGQSVIVENKPGAGTVIGVDAVAKANNFGLVMAYPDATNDEERKSPVYFDMKLRPTAAMPFYIAPGNDITDAIVATLNKFCPPPPGSGVTPAAGTAPAAPGAGAVPTPGKP